jgi:hypothetical protein
MLLLLLLSLLLLLLYDILVVSLALLLLLRICDYAAVADSGLILCSCVAVAAMLSYYKTSFWINCMSAKFSGAAICLPEDNNGVLSCCCCCL